MLWFSPRWKERRVRRYLEALALGDWDEMADLFAPTAIVHSPIYGSIGAEAFYRALFADTDQSAIELLDVYDSIREPGDAAVRFHYDWTLRSGKRCVFECVDIIRFEPETKRIAALTIIYDTAAVRDDKGRPFATGRAGARPMDDE